MKSPRNKALLMHQPGGDILAVTPQIKTVAGRIPNTIAIFNLNYMPQSNNFFICLNYLNLGITSIVEQLKNKAQTLKYLKCKVPFLLLILLPHFTQSQNLVPNPSFEEYLECPFSTGEFHNQVIDWYSWQETPDIFHPCSDDIDGFAGVPANAWGHQNPITGESYASLITYTYLLPNAREFIACPLIESLELGEEYYVFLHASQFDGGAESDSWCATNNIGIRFFKDPNYSISNPFNPMIADNFAHINFNEVLNDTTNWIKIDGWILADDTYNWIAIGNFYDDNQTQTQILNINGNCFSIYYIENICVAKTAEECDYLLNQTGISNSIHVINLFPNPVSTHLQIQSSQQLINEIKVFNAIGQLVSGSIHHGKNVIIETGHWSVGLYILEVKTEDGFIKPFKVLKQ